MSILANWILSALAILLVASYVPGVEVDRFTTALIVSLALGVANVVIKPIINILTLPINILTLGMFSFIVNALLILLVAYFVNGFTISGFFPALLAAFALWAINLLIHLVLFPIKAIKT
jgi:putative membrane protein